MKSLTVKISGTDKYGDYWTVLERDLPEKLLPGLLKSYEDDGYHISWYVIM